MLTILYCLQSNNLVYSLYSSSITVISSHQRSAVFSMRGGLGSDQSSMDRDSFEDLSAEEMMVIADNIDNLNLESEGEEAVEEEPSKSLIVTNVDISVLNDDLAKTGRGARGRGD